MVPPSKWKREPVSEKTVHTVPQRKNLQPVSQNATMDTMGKTACDENGRAFSRRDYLKTSLLGAGGLFLAPAIVPSSVLGTPAPNDRINVGQIGFGRIAWAHDLPETMKHEDVRVVAVCDVDEKRMLQGKQFVEQWYAEKTGSANAVDVAAYQDYRELLARSDVDAVIISTPDHAHFLPTVEAALAGKDIYLQKPLSLTIEEGRIMSDTLNRLGTVFQIGSQQRSVNPWPQFRRACELVRNGRIGALHTVRVGLPGDPAGGDPTPMRVPGTLNYDAWLGTTPYVPYTLDRVHPQEPGPDGGYSRPGWLRCEQFTAGMITGWGAHHVDTAHWGMGTEYTGPIEVEARATFPTRGLWDVHGDFQVEAEYENGVHMYVSGQYPNGVRFEGEDGWIFVTRGPAQVTSSDPTGDEDEEAPLQASDPSILDEEIGENETRLYESEEQHTNWVRSIRSRDKTVAPAEVAHRSCSACLIAHIAMKVTRRLYWDPVNERFQHDEEANAMLSRPQRHPYTMDNIPELSAAK